jgi:hypothetical protein
MTPYDEGNMGTDTTQPGVNEVVEVETVVQAPAADKVVKSERELAIERIAEQRNRQFEQDEGVKLSPDPEPEPTKTEPAKPVDEALDAASQIGKQLESGQILLDEQMLSRAFVKQKVDGREELVPAEKVFRQYQKGAAADLRLAEATRMQKEAQDALAAAQEKLKTATTSTERKEAEAAVTASSDLLEKGKELVNAMYSGDEEKTGKMLLEYVTGAVQSALAGREQATPKIDDIVNRAVQAAVPAMKQQLSVEGALEQLQKDYPEIWADADLALIADRYVNEFEAQGKSRAQAISEAGDAVGTKFKIGKFAARPDGGDSTTMRSEKLEKKRALDEPKATSARASNDAPAPQSASDIIAEMRRARNPSMA